MEYIILAFALAMSVMVTVRGCALKTPIRLTRGLAVSFLIALEHVLLILAGMYIGNMYLGLLVVVAFRMVIPAFRKKEKELPAYNIANWTTVLLLGVATGINTLFVGLGLGFRVSFAADLWRVAIPLFVILFVLCYLAIMLGRQKKEMRARRWQLIAVLFLLIFAIKGAFFSN